MTQVEFLEKLWLSYQKMCKEKCIDAGTKERFMAAQQPKHYSTDTLLVKTQKPTSPLLVKTQKPTSPLAEQHVPDINVREINTVKDLTPLFKIYKGNDFILTRTELRKIIEDAINRGYELGKKEAEEVAHYQLSR